jgi:hypothetical protein
VAGRSEMEKKTFLILISVGVILAVIIVGFFETMGKAISEPTGNKQPEYMDYTTIRVYADEVNPRVNVVVKPITEKSLVEYEGEI